MVVADILLVWTQSDPLKVFCCCCCCCCCCLTVISFFIFGCTGSSLLSSSCRAQALGCTSFGSCGAWAQKLHLACCRVRACSCGTGVQLPWGMWDPPRQGIKLVPLALQGGLSTTGPPGRPGFLCCNSTCRVWIHWWDGALLYLCPSVSKGTMQRTTQDFSLPPHCSVLLPRTLIDDSFLCLREFCPLLFQLWLKVFIIISPTNSGLDKQVSTSIVDLVVQNSHRKEHIRMQLPSPILGSGHLKEKLLRNYPVTQGREFLAPLT